MKFAKLKMHNFMRYRGDHDMIFSCDPVNNVTVVLGENTFGKSTIAEAFRWGLYGDGGLIGSKYVKKSEIVLLNNEVIAALKPGQIADVYVEITMVEGDTTWRFRRTAAFSKKTSNPSDMSVKLVSEPSLTMQLFEGDAPGIVINNDGNNTGATGSKYKAGCVDDAINNMLPKTLSNYFFFDGERWNDNKTAKNEVKQSIETILGVAGLMEMIKHLKGGNVNVINSLHKKLQGSGDEYERIKQEITELENKLARIDENLEKNHNDLDTFSKKRDELESELANNKNTEEDMKELARLKSGVAMFEKQADEAYADIIKQFSGSSRYFASLLLPDVKALLEDMDLEGKDIPDITVYTIDYLLEKGTCLCDHCIIEKDGEIYNALMQLRKVIPPQQIGGAVGKFEATLESWADMSTDLISSIIDKANIQDESTSSINDYKRDIDKIEARMDRKTDVEALRRNYNAHVGLCKRIESDINKLEFDKKQYEQDLDQKNTTLDTISRQSKANDNVRSQIAYATTLYTMAAEQKQTKVETVAEELNEIIGKNFDKMFNDKEKYAALSTDDYKVHVYYKDLGGLKGHEEQVLSPGERTAINFVYIVSVLELAKKRREQSISEDDEGSVMNLPIVLDGPFSTLSDTNISLVASKLPSFAEQIIIFVLDKDWESSGLDKYTNSGYRYRVIKEPGSNSSRLIHEEV